MIPLGNLIWNVEPVTPYVVGNRIPVVISIHNDDVTSHTYTLTVVTAKGTTAIETYTIDVGAPIVVDAGDTIQYVGMLRATVDDCTLTLELINGDIPGGTTIIDSLQTTIVPTEAASSNLTLIGGAISGGMLNSIIEIMLVMMIMKMMIQTTTQTGNQTAKQRQLSGSNA
jgi:hypothetical protein